MTEDYRQTRCRHGWVNPDECQDCKDIAALTSQRDKATQDVVDLMKQRRTLLDERETFNKQIATLATRVKELESAMNLFGEDPSWCELLVDKCAEITKQEEEIAALTAEIKGWRHVIRECERLLCNDKETAKSPLMSNLPNLIRDMTAERNKLRQMMAVMPESFWASQVALRGEEGE